MYKVNKQRCTACQVCVRTCLGATQIGIDGKAEVIDQDKLKECGGEIVCPFGAIERTEGESKPEEPQPQPRSRYLPSGRRPSSSRGRGIGRRRRQGRGGGRKI